MMTIRPSHLVFALCSLLAACGSDDSDDGSGTGGTAGSGGGQALSAPVLETVMPMAPAGIHVTWQNVQSDCEEIEGERKTATAEYAVVFTVPGSVDNEHDGTATEKVEYTYRVRCRKGTDYSPYSNELSATPP